MQSASCNFKKMLIACFRDCFTKPCSSADFPCKVAWKKKKSFLFELDHCFLISSCADAVLITQRRIILIIDSWHSCHNLEFFISDSSPHLLSCLPVNETLKAPARILPQAAVGRTEQPSVPGSPESLKGLPGRSHPALWVPFPSPRLLAALSLPAASIQKGTSEVRLAD